MNAEELKAEWLKTLNDCAELEQENARLRERLRLNKSIDEEDDESFSDQEEKHESMKKKWLQTLEDAAEMEVEIDSLREQLEKERNRTKNMIKQNDTMSRELNKSNKDNNPPSGLTEKEKELLIALREKTSSDTSIDLALNTLVVLSGSLSRSEESEKLLERHLMYREDQDSQKYELSVLEFELQDLKNKWKECLQRKKRLDVDEEKIEDKRSVTKKRPSACSPRGVRPRRRELSVKSTCRRSGWLLKSNWWNRSGTISATIGPSTIRRRLSSTSSISGSSSPAATALWNKVTGAATNVLRPERKRYFILDDCSLTLRYFLEKPSTNWRELKCERGIIALQDLIDISMVRSLYLMFTRTTLLEGFNLEHQHSKINARIQVHDDEDNNNNDEREKNNTSLTLTTKRGRVYGLKAANTKEAHAWYLDLIDCRRGCEGAPISDSSSSKLMEKEEDNSDDDVAEEDESEKEEERTRRAMEEAEKQHRELMQIMSNRSEYQKFTTTRTRLFEMSTVSVWPSQHHKVRVPIGGDHNKFGRVVAVKWSFETRSYDISFHVRFVPSDRNETSLESNASANAQRVPSHRTPQKGTFRIPSGTSRRGYVVLYWGNHYSRLRRKELKYRVDVISSHFQIAS